MSGELQHTGTCDASAAVPIGSGRFVVASDEDDVLRVYHSASAGGATDTFDLSGFLALGERPREADIEGATRINDTIYWITSHGRNSEGRERPTRYRLFATEVAHESGRPMIRPIGVPYTQLLQDLLQEGTLARYHLGEAAMLAPKEQGALNIEGLASTPDGRLLIGFRNPIPDGEALVVPLENPRDVLQGARARFGAPVLLDLGGLGIRSIEYWESRGLYLIVAGAYDQGPFHLYQWSGDGPAARMEGIDLQELNPEALIIYPELADRFQILSDDGETLVGGTACKDLGSDDQKSFRSAWVTISP
jgi:hypothetical protein